MLYLALTLANSASALLLPTNPGRVVKVRMTATESTAPAETKVFPTPAYDGLVLPYNTGGTNDNIYAKVNSEVGPFLLGIGGGSRMLAPFTPPNMLAAGFKGVFIDKIIDKVIRTPTLIPTLTLILTLILTLTNPNRLTLALTRRANPSKAASTASSSAYSRTPGVRVRVRVS